MYAKKPPGLLSKLWWIFRHWVWNHRKMLLIIQIVIALCVLSAVITAYHPT